MHMCIMLFTFSDFSFVAFLPYNLYSVVGDVKHRRIQSKRVEKKLFVQDDQAYFSDLMGDTA